LLFLLLSLKEKLQKDTPAKDRKETRYDAFISYSGADRHFAAALEKALEAYKPPKNPDVPPTTSQNFSL